MAATSPAHLAFGDQVRQQRGEGEAADTHGDHQGEEAGEQADQRGHGGSPKLVIGFPC
ncbi:hypothetical protein D9M71_696760 [compost metagenome]